MRTDLDNNYCSAVDPPLETATASDGSDANHARASAGSIRLAIALLLCAVAVRPLAVSLGPVLPDISVDLGLSALLVGVVGMLPVICLGLFAPLGVVLANRLRPEGALAVALGVAVAFGAARAFAPDPGTLLAMTAGLGVGMGMAGPIPSMIIKARAPGRPVMLTSAHGVGIVGGATLGAVLIVPLSVAAAGWRGGTLLVSVPILLSTLVGLIMLGRGRSVQPDRGRAGVGWRDPVAWLLTGIFGLQSFVYWALVIWLAAMLVEAGWSTTGAGAAVAIYQVASFAGVITVGLVADRWGTRRHQLLVAAGAVTASMLSMILVSDLALAWIGLAGYALGAALPLALTLPVDLGRDEHDTGGKAGLMLLVGYLLAALGPTLIGLVREHTLAPAPIFGTLAACGIAFVLLSSRLPAGRRRVVPPLPESDG